MMTNSLKDRTAVVTGSGRGIGREIALLLGTRGAKIVVSDIDSDNSSKTTEEFKKQGIEAISIPANVTSSDDAENLVRGAVEAFGSIDILVNNAGVTRDNLLARMSEEDWDMVMNINLKGAFLVTRSAARVMIKKRYGRIINIASVVGVVGNAGQANYSASKAGLIGLTKSTARELAGRGVTANAVAPGFIETDMTNAMSEKAQEKFLESVPLKRKGKPKDVAEAVAFLASDSAAYITGQTLSVCGGLNI